MEVYSCWHQWQYLSLEAMQQNMATNIYRAALQYERKTKQDSALPQVCLHCAGWKTFGGVLAPMYIAEFGPICCCNDTWQKIKILLVKMKNNHLL